MNIFFILPSIKNFLIILGILCRFEEINISITYSTKQKKILIHILVYKKQFLQQVKILYFCLGWVEILMTPLYDIHNCKKAVCLVLYTLWHFRLWSFPGRDTKLERFLAKNQLYSNEITKFLELE